MTSMVSGRAALQLDKSLLRRAIVNPGNNSKVAADAWLIGKAFRAVQSKVRHGNWLRWVEEKCSGISRVSATRYKELAERLTLKDVEGCSLTEAYRKAEALR